MRGLDDDERATLELAGSTREERTSPARALAARRLAVRGLVTLTETIDVATGLTRQTMGRTPLGQLALRVHPPTEIE